MAREITKPVPVLRWATTLAWAALIFCLSTQTFSLDFSRGLLVWTLHLLHLHLSSHTFVLLHASLRKLAHLIEYGILALLLYGLPGGKSRTLWRPRRAAFCILGAIVYSLTDELHQRFVPGRHPSLTDCGIDSIGGAIGILIYYASHLRLRTAGGPTRLTMGC